MGDRLTRAVAAPRTRTFRVGVFPKDEYRPGRFVAYLRGAPDWSRACVHTVEADNGYVAKQRAIDEHKARCVEAKA